MDPQIDSKLFHDFHQKIAMPLRPPLASRRLLEEFSDIDVTAEAVARIIQGNQYLEHLLVNEIKALGMKENTPKLQGAIALFGMSRTRDFICALQILRQIGGRHPSADKNGRSTLKPAEYVKFAQRTEELVSARLLKYPDTAYAAGLLFDRLLAIARENFGDPDGFVDYAAEIHKHGVRTALVAIELAKAMKATGSPLHGTFGSSKYLFAACLIHDAGKLVLELLYPKTKPNAYAAFRQAVAEKPVSRAIRHFVEQSLFGYSHEHYSAQLAQHFQLFRPVERALLFHHDPYGARAAGKETHQLALLLAVASNVATTFRVPRDTADPIFNAWLTPEVKELSLARSALLAVVQKVSESGLS
ncbi:MAG: HDOD domain-containing protein [Deltaproteobacteria bacterium]|nr:HDOD domain-containing protein [Deltaproteobacteria bacterium]